MRKQILSTIMCFLTLSLFASPLGIPTGDDLDSLQVKIESALPHGQEMNLSQEILSQDIALIEQLKSKGLLEAAAHAWEFLSLKVSCLPCLAK